MTAETTRRPRPGLCRDDDLQIPVHGETVAASRCEPADADGPLPVVLIATPYRKDDRISFGSWGPSIEYIARAGYAVVVADLIGTGASTGRKDPFSGDEGPEVASIIEWLADRPWTTGAVGTFGLSYGAWTQYLAAAENPDPLKAIVPVAVSPSVYESSCTGGVFNPLKRATWAAEMQAMLALPPSRRDQEGRWARVWRDRLDDLRDGTPWLFEFLAHERTDEFWDGREVGPEKIDVPTLAACGYRDVHTRSMVEFFDRIDAPKRLLLGPWRHTMPERGRESAIDFRRQVVEWFDRFLKGEDNDALASPTVAYWTERKGGWTSHGTWRGTDRWPSLQAAVDQEQCSIGGGSADRTHTVDADAEVLSFALTSDGLVRSTEFTDGSHTPVEREYAYDHTVGIESVDRVGSVTNPGIATNADDARSIVFETGPLERPVEFTGTGLASIELRASTPSPVLAVRVSDVDPNGVARSVTGGYRRTSHRNGHERPDPLTHGREYRIEVPLKPKSHVFESGHRIRVAVSAAAFPRSLPPNEQGTLTVLSSPASPSLVRFPGQVHDDGADGADGDVDFEDAIEMRPPDDDIVPVDPPVSAANESWETAREHTGGTAAFRAANRYTVALPHGADLHWASELEASVVADAPGTASLRNDVSLALEYDLETVRVETTAHTSRAAASLHTMVRIDDHVIFDETWYR